MRLSITCLALLVACGQDSNGSLDDASALPPADGGHDPLPFDGDVPLGDATARDPVVDAGLDQSTDASDSGGAPLEIEVLQDVTKDGGVRYQLLRLTRPPQAPTYAQWFPPVSTGEDRPVVVYTKPYDGIDWTGEEVDRRWADGGTGAQQDVDSPDAGANPGIIMYAPLAPETVEDNNIYRLHDMGTLLLYGRFYAGGDVQNDIDDMTTGLDFLRDAPNVDNTRIGIFGGSWGGFEAVYGAAYAHEDVKPSVGVALSPLSDFEVEVDFVTRDLPMRYALQPSRDACATFFAPYLRRIAPTRAARGGYEGLRATDLAARIDAPFLLIHEDWDTLVSFEQSTKLVELAPSVFQPLWLLHSDPPFLWDTVVNGHGPLLTEYATPSITFALTFLLTHLADDDQPISTLWDGAKMRALSSAMRDRQREGKDVAFYAARLRELTDPRVSVVDFGTGATRPGPDAIAAEVNAVWDTNFTAADVREQLARGLPP